MAIGNYLLDTFSYPEYGTPGGRANALFPFQLLAAALSPKLRQESAERRRIMDLAREQALVGGEDEVARLRAIQAERARRPELSTAGLRAEEFVPKQAEENFKLTEERRAALEQARGIEKELHEEGRPFRVPNLVAQKALLDEQINAAAEQRMGASQERLQREELFKEDKAFRGPRGLAQQGILEEQLKAIRELPQREREQALGRFLSDIALYPMGLQDPTIRGAAEKLYPGYFPPQQTGPSPAQRIRDAEGRVLQTPGELGGGQRLVAPQRSPRGQIPQDPRMQSLIERERAPVKEQPERGSQIGKVQELLKQAQRLGFEKPESMFRIGEVGKPLVQHLKPSDFESLFRFMNWPGVGDRYIGGRKEYEAKRQTLLEEARAIIEQLRREYE